jgi:hypothetical protein
MRLPEHEDHDLAECAACNVFDQVHAERDDLRIEVRNLDTTIEQLLVNIEWLKEAHHP